MITMDQVYIHMVGDYITQSSWMANNKTQTIWSCTCHVVVYSLGFLLLTQDPISLLIIGGSHYIIDHWRLAKYVCFAKNHLAPMTHWPKWEECQTTGYSNDTPIWLSTWLLIIVDNLLHIGINALVINQLGG